MYYPNMEPNNFCLAKASSIKVSWQVLKISGARKIHHFPWEFVPMVDHPHCRTFVLIFSLNYSFFHFSHQFFFCLCRRNISKGEKVGFQALTLNTRLLAKLLYVGAIFPPPLLCIQGIYFPTPGPTAITATLEWPILLPPPPQYRQKWLLGHFFIACLLPP